MKRSSDYGNQNHENIKKPRFGQGYNYSSLNSGMRNDLAQASDLYTPQFPPVGPSAMMMSSHSYSQGSPGFHGHQGGHFAGMGYQHGAGQYSAGMSQYTPGVNSMIPQFGGFSGAQFAGAYQGAAVTSATNSTGRTVYVGNIPADMQIDELLNHVRVGPIESVRVLSDKNCAFISFMDGTAAAAFYHDATNRKIVLHGQELKIGWGKPSTVPTSVHMAVTTQNATRNVYLGNLDDSITDAVLREDLGKFGPIDTVKIVREKNIGFVHFLSISSAIKAVQSLQQDPKYGSRKVNYGKDRCAARSGSGNGNMSSQYTFGAAAMGFQGFGAGGALGFTGFDHYHTGHMDNGGELRSPTSPLFSSASSAAGSTASVSAGNRTIYLGNIHPETTCEEICNVIRGGILQQIRYLPEKHIAFVTFVDPAAGNNFMYMAQNGGGVVIKNRRLKVGWGKNLGPLPASILQAMSQHAASRNVYVGQIDDTITEEKLRRDFSEYGEIELVNILKEKNCGFVNFTSIANAIKAIEGMKQKEEYKKFRINYGKDRCGNPPRGLGLGGGGGGGSKGNKGRHSGESDARILHGGDAAESDVRKTDEEIEDVDEFADA